MTAKEFLSKLNSTSSDKRSAFAQTILTLPKLAAAEAVETMLGDLDLGVRINAIRAIRKFELDIYEKRLISLLIDEDEAVRVAAFKSLCSFGKAEHFKLAVAFYEENAPLRSMAIDSFVNFSDRFEAHIFMFSLLDSKDEKVRGAAIDWFEKALNRTIFTNWIAQVYTDAAWSLRMRFEELFADKLTALFSHPLLGWRFKLVWLKKAKS
ncbi:hypothetical protein FACS189487_07330 [Campylobacterota bacterium]|nr:hypothetical protein FACS189487_07330 [Campylobacterota bacterium]